MNIVCVAAMCAGLATPFYGARVSSDAMSAMMEGIGHPRVPGGGVDQTVAALDEAGLESIVEVADVYAAGVHEAMVGHVRGGIASEQGAVSRMLDRGRLVGNLTAVMERQEQRTLPLLYARRYAVEVCEKGKKADWWWSLIERSLGEDSGTSKAVPAGLLTAFKADVDVRCQDVLDAIDSEAIRADMAAFEQGSVNDFMLDALLLRYEPGQRQRVDG